MKRRNLQGVRTYGSSEEPTTRSFLMLLYAYSIRVTYSCSDLSVVIYCTLLFCTALHRHVSVLLLSDIAIMHIGCTILSAITLPLSFSYLLSSCIHTGELVQICAVQIYECMNMTMMCGDATEQFSNESHADNWRRK